MVFESGKIYTINGPSGCGKSTLLEIMAGLRIPTTGTVTIANEDIHTIRPNQRCRIVSLIDKDSFILPITLRENLMLVDREATESDLIKVLKVTRLYDFVQSLPDKLDQVLDKASETISLGEACRLSIARSLLNRPQFLLLDEATSCIDEQMEESVFCNIRETFPELSIIAVTHRMKTVNMADRILTMATGRLQQQLKEAHFI
jgi:ABC-type transport system involved in cytochrome bd biosynthesis fused ATPase/permease subunit